MVEASEIRAEPDILQERGIKTNRKILERGVAIDRLAANVGDIYSAIALATPIHRIRKGVKIHVPADYYAVFYTESRRGGSRIHGIFEYSEPEAPHKIDELPDLQTKGIIRKSYDIRLVYVSNDREDFNIRIPEFIYSSRSIGLTPILTTDLLPVHYRIFRLEVQPNDPNAFLTRLITKRIRPTYFDLRIWILQELYWIISTELTRYDLLGAIKDKAAIQKNVQEKFASRLGEIALELLAFVWDYDIEDNIRDRYFWLHVQKIPSLDVLRMETLVNMSKELSKSPQGAIGGSQSILSDPLRSKEATSSLPK